MNKKRTQPCQTQFLGWDRPLLRLVVEYLWNEYSEDAEASGQWPLGGFLAVLPTRRAARRLRDLLEHAADERGLTVQLPRIITVGDLPEYLYRRSAAEGTLLANELERTLAWAGVLEQSEPAALAPLFPVLPPRDSLTPWLELAGTVRRLHEDLAAAELSFADVAAELASDEATAAERKRWEALQSLHAAYLASLAAGGRSDPFDARARAIAQGDCGSDYHILLIGTSDLSESVRAMLRAACEPAATKGTPKHRATSITALVAADPQYRDHFDPFGSIIASRWCQWKLPLRDEQLIAAGDATDQAAVAAGWISAFAEKYSPPEIAIGVTDESLVPPVEVELRQMGQRSCRELGWSFAQTPPGRLLELLTVHLAQQTWQSLAALVRHADVYQFIDETLASAGLGQRGGEQYAGGRWLVSLDELLAEHYPTRLDVPLSARMTELHGGAIAAMNVIGDSLTAFSGHRRMPISQWAEELERWLTAVYQPLLADGESEPGATEEPNSAARRTREAVEASRNVLQRMEKLQSSLDAVMHAAPAIELLAGQLLQLRVSDDSAEDAVTILGWLDLALEDAPAMVIVGVNQPYVPESITADPFLPGNLRTRLRMSDNERRLGRDIYALQLVLATRRDVRLIVGRTGVDGSPTPPSRLLAAAEPADAARWLVRLLDDDAIRRRELPTQPHRPVRWHGPQPKTRLPIPVLDGTFRVKAMSVTSFSAYLNCPYRFYLRHVLKLGPIDDASRELAANQFGDLVHNSLEIFGNSDAKDATDERVIEESLLDSLDQFASEYLGSAPAPAVRLQIEQARRRLRHVAKVQAQWRRAGWHIQQVEASVGEQNNAGIDVDGQRMIIRGRFDRIDRHDDGRWAILDYKTHGHLPRKKHLKKVAGVDRWVDLQLPIYRLMIPYLVGDEVDPQRVALGYFNVSEKEAETRINEADFTAAEFAAADELIIRCIRDIWAGRFEPSPDPVEYDDYAMILQAGSGDLFIEADEAEVLLELPIGMSFGRGAGRDE